MHCGGDLVPSTNDSPRGSAPNLRCVVVAVCESPLRIAMLASALLSLTFSYAPQSPDGLEQVLALLSISGLCAIALAYHAIPKAPRNSPIITLSVLTSLTTALPWLAGQAGGPWLMTGLMLFLAPIFSLAALALLTGGDPDSKSKLARLPSLLAAMKDASLMVLVTGSAVLTGWTLLVDFSSVSLPMRHAILVNSILLALILLGFGAWLKLQLDYHGLLNGPQREKDKDTLPPPVVSAEQILNAQIDILLKEGQFEQACERLQDEVKRNRQPLRVDAMYRLMLALGDNEGLLQHSHLFLRLLCQRGDNDQALTLLAQLRHKDPKFKVFDAQLCLQLAQICRHLKQHKQLLWLTAEAHLRFEEENAVAELYLLTAKTLLEAFNEAAKARAYLQHIQQHFADHICAKQAGILLNHITTQARG